MLSARDDSCPTAAEIWVVRGDVRPVRREMARAADHENVWLVGGGDVARVFHDVALSAGEHAHTGAAMRMQVDQVQIDAGDVGAEAPFGDRSVLLITTHPTLL